MAPTPAGTMGEPGHGPRRRGSVFPRLRAPAPRPSATTRHRSGFHRTEQNRNIPSACASHNVSNRRGVAGPPRPAPPVHHGARRRTSPPVGPCAHDGAEPGPGRFALPRPVRHRRRPVPRMAGRVHSLSAQSGGYAGPLGHASPKRREAPGGRKRPDAPHGRRPGRSCAAPARGAHRRSAGAGATAAGGTAAGATALGRCRRSRFRRSPAPGAPASDAK